MCDFDEATGHQHFGYLVDNERIRNLVNAALLRPGHRATFRRASTRRGPRLLSCWPQDWLPDRFAEPDQRLQMGGGIGQYALYRASANRKSLCLFSLVIPPDR